MEGTALILFVIHAVTCITIRTTESYWRYIVEVKHPESFKRIGIEKAANQAKEALSKPEEVIKGRVDPSVHLYYKSFHGYFTCVVAKHLNGEGYIITPYRTDRIGGGEVVWERR